MLLTPILCLQILNFNLLHFYQLALLGPLSRRSLWSSLAITLCPLLDLPLSDEV